MACCSSEQLYNAIRDNRIQDCENIPIPQQDHCRSLYQTTYEEYARDLDELRSEGQSQPGQSLKSRIRNFFDLANLCTAADRGKSPCFTKSIGILFDEQYLILPQDIQDLMRMTGKDHLRIVGIALGIDKQLKNCCNHARMQIGFQLIYDHDATLLESR